jgi:hypothetical protein
MKENYEDFEVIGDSPQEYEGEQNGPQSKAFI